MKKYLLKFLFAIAVLSPVLAKTTVEITHTKQTPSLLGKFIVVKEDREIIRDGKTIEETSEAVEDGLIYQFKSENLVCIYWDGADKGINFTINRTGKTYELNNKKGEAEDDILILKKNTPTEVIFVRELMDGDEDGEILVRSTLYLKPIK